MLLLFLVSRRIFHRMIRTGSGTLPSLTGEKTRNCVFARSPRTRCRCAMLNVI
jgi:hypothetical protein